MKAIFSFEIDFVWYTDVSSQFFLQKMNFSPWVKGIVVSTMESKKILALFAFHYFFGNLQKLQSVAFQKVESLTIPPLKLKHYCMTLLYEKSKVIIPETCRNRSIITLWKSVESLNSIKCGSVIIFQVWRSKHLTSIFFHNSLHVAIFHQIKGSTEKKHD